MDTNSEETSRGIRYNKGRERKALKVVTMDTTITHRGTDCGAFSAALVDLFDSRRLCELARARTPESRVDLTDAVASFFNVNLKTHETELAADILMSLLQQAETDLRQALAERLASNERVPLRVVLSLANDEICVARPILRHSPVLNELDLFYIIQSQPLSHWEAIASRRDLTPAIVDALVEKREESTARALLANDSVGLTNKALKIFVAMSEVSDGLRLPLSRRPELPLSLARDLYHLASRELQKDLNKRFPQEAFASLLADVMDDAVEDSLNAVAGTLPATPSAASQAAVRNYNARNVVAPPKLIEALRLGQFSYFLALFAEYTGLQSCMIDTLMKQRGGKGLAIACKACHMERSDFLTLFMLKTSLASRDKIVDHNEISQALATFDRVQAAVAQKMLSKAAAGNQTPAFA